MRTEKYFLFFISTLIQFSFLNLLDANSDLLALNSTENFIYKSTPSVELKTYVFKPKEWSENKRFSAIVFYFGGGWNTRHISQFVEYAKYYSSKGYVCFIPNYRVRSTENSRAIDSVLDAQDAFSFIRKNALRFALDSNKIIASGGSAGGHLAASLATLEDHRNNDFSKPNALILFNPVCVVDNEKNPRRFSFERLGVRGTEISPYHNIKKDMPPTIIFHGTEDRLVAFKTAESFHEKMLKMNNDCTLVPFVGRDHGFFNHGKHLANSDYKKTLEYIDEFLIRIGF